MRKRTNKSFCLEFHKSYLIVALGFILTGNYLNLIVFTSLILVHEMGHYFMAMLFHLKVKKIVIYPFGGVTKLDTMINLDISCELLVALSGVMVQFLFYLFLSFLNQIHMISEYTMQLYTLYNSQIIFFNLMPIYPLDGAKIFNLLISKFCPYYVSNLITIIISILGIFFLIFLNVYTFNYSNIMIYFLFFTYLIRFYQKRKYIYYRFLLERYLYTFSFSQTKVIYDYRFMYRDKKHFIYDGRIYLEERNFLSKIFD